MRRISEKDFIGANADPFFAQPARQVTAQGRGEPLRDNQPNAGADRKFRRRGNIKGPRRDGRKAQARAERDQHDRNCYRGKGATRNGEAELSTEASGTRSVVVVIVMEEAPS